MITLVSAGAYLGQSRPPERTMSDQSIRSSPAYAEVLLRKTELEAELESQLLDHTEEFPKVKDIRMELELMRSEMDRLLAVKAADVQKLSSALGRLILAKIGHQTKLRQLRLQYSDDHPTVRRQRKTVEIYEAAIKEILG
jgi:hypothetical protein